MKSKVTFCPDHDADALPVKGYLSDIGGSHPLVFWGSITASLLLSQAFNVSQSYWVGYWAQQYQDHDRLSVSVS